MRFINRHTIVDTKNMKRMQLIDWRAGEVGVLNIINYNIKISAHGFPDSHRHRH